MKEEPVDILDGRGRKTGQTMLKSEAHNKGLWHGGAHVWIYNGRGEVLLQQRSLKKVVWPGVWDVSVAGHIGAGKEPLATVVEEAKEELGITIRPQDVHFLGNAIVDETMPGGWQHRVYLWIYAARADVNLKDLKLEEGETDDVKWVTVDELKADLNDPSQAKRFASIRGSYDLAIQKIPELIKKYAKTGG